MKHELFSELRTIYETTVENPHTFRVTVKTKDMVDEEILKRAVAKTTKRHPYFCVKLVMEGDDIFFEDNDKPMPVLHTDGPVTLGGEQVDEHLMSVSWWKNKIHFEIYHALTDGGGVYPFIKTLLYYYCSEYYEMELSTDGIRLTDDPVDPAEWEDPGRIPIKDAPVLLVDKWEQPAFQIKDGGAVEITKNCIVYNIRIPEDEFMRFNMSNDGSPGTVVSLFLARAIERVHPGKKEPTVIAMCVNQRKALHAPLAHQSLVGDVRLVYDEKIINKDFNEQCTCFRGMVALQSDESVVMQEIKTYQDIMKDLDALPTIRQKHKYCIDRMDHMTSCFTATVSYVGKVDMGEAEQFVQEFHALPSTALPSSATPLTLEISAMNGSVYINFMQYFKDECYLKAFIKDLRDNDINYDVLYAEDTKYPNLIDLWGLLGRSL